jgi:hypothetical protein
MRGKNKLNTEHGWVSERVVCDNAREEHIGYYLTSVYHLQELCCVGSQMALVAGIFQHSCVGVEGRGLVTIMEEIRNSYKMESENLKA